MDNNGLEVTYQDITYNLHDFRNNNLESCLYVKNCLEKYFDDNREKLLTGVLSLSQIEYASCLNRIIELKGEK